MTDTPAESAEAPRTPEEIARDAAMLAEAESIACAEDWDCNGDKIRAIATLVRDYARAALAARDAEWVEAVTKTFGRLAMEMVMAGTAANSGALRALLSEGKPGQ
jgi:hypothetical protein